MANRRMFSLDIVDTDAFLDMPSSAQNLYFHIGMRCDDDGFCANPQRIIKILGASKDDLNILLLKKFLLPCNNGVVVMKHWWMHNTKRKDTYKRSNYLDDNPELKINGNKAYTYSEDGVRYLSVNGALTQDNISKVNISKNNILPHTCVHEEEEKISIPTIKEIDSFIKDNELNVNSKQFFNYYNALGWKINGQPITNWKALLLTWNKNKEKETSSTVRVVKKPDWLEEYERNFMDGVEEL